MTNKCYILVTAAMIYVAAIAGDMIKQDLVSELMELQIPLNDPDEEHKYLRCYVCNFTRTKACGDPFDRNDKYVTVAKCPNHSVCYHGTEYDDYRNLKNSVRGCVLNQDGKDGSNKYHFYCNFDLCNGAIGVYNAALNIVPFILLSRLFVTNPQYYKK